MGFWLNNFAELERKQNRRNRLVLNFHYSASVGEEARSLKVYAPCSVTVPTGFLKPEQRVKELKKKLRRKKFAPLREFPVTQRKVSGFQVLEIELPYETRLIRLLDELGEFQTGSYDRLLRFSGLWPERKVTSGLEGVVDGQEVNLNNLKFGDFMTLEEFKQQNYVVVDIEKPLWKHDDEKAMIKERKGLLKLEKKYFKLEKRTAEDDNLHEARIKQISEIESKLKQEYPDVGEIALYDERFNADISFVSVLWGNNGIREKEVYVLDARDEFGDIQEYNGYRVLRFRKEAELVKALTERFHEKKPIISYGHNQVYDHIQLRFAADTAGIVFDPAVRDVKPRRDFVRYFLQRQREDNIYLDTMWCARNFFSFLQQRSLGTNLKLDGVARFLGIDFNKQQTHAELRPLELERIAGKTPEIRRRAMLKALDYSVADLDATDGIREKLEEIILPVIHRIKQACPFLTYTEIAFSPNCMQKLHDYIHFRRAGNMRFYEYAQKIRENELQIFKKRFKAKKNEMVNWAFDLAGLQVGGEVESSGERHQYYIPFEEWLGDFAFSLQESAGLTGLRQTYEQVRKDERQRLGFLQYLKAFLRDPLTDYYFARREAGNYKFALDCMDVKEEEAAYNFHKLEEVVDSETLNKLHGSFKYLKNHFRSVYVDLNKDGRARIRVSRGNLAELDYPKIMEKDADLYLLRENSAAIEKSLSEFKRKELKSFLTNFETFENLVNEIGKQLTSSEASELKFPYLVFDFLYAYVQHKRADDDKKRFFAKYGQSVHQVAQEIGQSYLRFAKELKDKSVSVLEVKGDYFFTSKKVELDNAVYVRKI